MNSMTKLAATGVMVAGAVLIHARNAAADTFACWEERNFCEQHYGGRLYTNPGPYAPWNAFYCKLPNGNTWTNETNGGFCLS